ncbi:MAG: ArsR/SmtB family transcription factor [Aggregatilineales bacterium]
MKVDVDSVQFGKLIGDETRQAIMKQLCCRWLSVNEVVEALGEEVGQPTISHHLKRLEEARLVIARQEGRQHFYTLNQAYFTACCGQLMRVFAPDYVPDVAPIDAKS